MNKRVSLSRFWSRESSSGGTGGQGHPEALGQRIRRTALILIGGGFLFCLFVGGWSWALGYAIGGGIAVANLELLRQGVARGLSSEKRKALPRLVSGSLLRLLGIGIALFVVLKFVPVHVIGLVLGLLVGPIAIVAAGFPGRDDPEEDPVD